MKKNARPIKFFLAVIFLFNSSIVWADKSKAYGNRIAELPIKMAEKLALAHASDSSGAIGRNKKSYFHVRFQTGMHHMADYGLVSKRSDVINRFLDAAEYAMKYQLSGGDFVLTIPKGLRHLGKANAADKASGMAFFLASVGMGILALETNDWFIQSQFRSQTRLNKIKTKLGQSIKYLKVSQGLLLAKDREAPNRLLYNALAYITLGELFNDTEALEQGREFVIKASALVDVKGGFFIEGGGYDSSYNAVASALSMRLVLLGFDEVKLEKVSHRAMNWQKTRILSSGEVSTQGNSRVNPAGSNESFMGREKDVDVAAVIESLVLSSVLDGDATDNLLAENVLSYYMNKK